MYSLRITSDAQTPGNYRVEYVTEKDRLLPFFAVWTRSMLLHPSSVIDVLDRLDALNAAALKEPTP